MCFFVTKIQGHDTYDSVQVSLPKAIPLYVHYTGNTMLHEGLWDVFGRH